MPARQVEWVCKTDRNQPHDRIASIGGGRGASAWRLSAREAIDKVEREGWGFYTRDPAGRWLRLVVALRLGQKYLKTEQDAGQPENLLALPDCPLQERLPACGGAGCRRREVREAGGGAAPPSGAPRTPAGGAADAVVRRA